MSVPTREPRAPRPWPTPRAAPAGTWLGMLAVAVLAAGAGPGPRAAAQTVEGPAAGGGAPADPARGLRPSLAACPLGARLAVARDEGRCVRARLGLLDAAPPVLTYLPVGSATLRAVPLELRGAWRSAYPADRNDGMMWSGRGLSGSTSGGLHLRAGTFTLVLAPEMARSANRAFPLPDTVPPGWSRWADPWTAPGLDRFLRPGDEVLSAWGPGDSFAQVAVGGARAGVSTERLWWGPARRYPLLFSGTAEGFGHLFAESDGEVPAGPGGVTLRALAGHLDESAWFDADESNDGRLLLAAQAAWRLGFVPGLEVALSLVRHEPRGGGGGGAAEGSGLGTFAFRLAFPEEGIEAYGEVGRGALFVNAIEGLSEAGHAQVYTLGMTRTDVSASGIHWRFWGELTKQVMELPQPPADPAAVALRAPSLPQGHTHRGQLLGSWTGPGSNAQAVGLDFPGDRGAIGIFAERVRRDDDTYFRFHQRNYGVHGHDLEWTVGARGARALALGRIGEVQAHLDAGVSRRKNRSFVGLDGGRNWTWVREWNGWADLRLVWAP